MTLTPEEQLELADLQASPPTTFDPEYAKVVLALRDSRRSSQPPWIDRATTLVALFASMIAIVTSGLTALVGYWDRSDRSAEQTFNNQVAITKIYFDKLAGGDPKTICADAELFSKAALTMARLEDADAARMLVGPSSASFPNSGVATGEQKLALVIYKDVQDRRAQRICDAVVPVQPPSQVGGVANAEPAGSADGATYASSPPQPVGNGMSVYIQVPAGDTGAERHAGDIAAKLKGNALFQLPGIQHVKVVPDHDQIRIYRLSDAPLARELQRLLGLEQAQVVNLGSAYARLPNKVMELWLTRTTTDRGTDTPGT